MTAEKEGLDDYTKGFVTGLIDKVAEERNADVSGADPLVDRTFQARNAMGDGLDQVGADVEGVDDA